MYFFIDKKGKMIYNIYVKIRKGNDNRGDGNGMLLAMMMMQGGFKFPTFEMPTSPVVTKVESKE